MVPLRRALRRVLRPIFLRQVEMFQEVHHRIDHLDHTCHAIRHELHAIARRQDELSEQLKTTLAFGWDYVAMVRRLATLEDQVALLTGNAAAGPDDVEAHPSILFPGLAGDRDEARSKVS